MNHQGFPDQEENIVWSETFHAVWARTKTQVKRFGWILLLTIAAGAAIQAARERSREPSYVSVARMIIHGKVAIPETGEGYNEDARNYFGTQISLMTSKRVLSDAAARVNAQLGPGENREASLNVHQEPSTTIFLLQATGSEPAYTRAFLDAAIDAYYAFRQELRVEASGDMVTKIQGELDQLTEEIQDLEQQAENFQAENSLVSIEKAGNLAATYLADLKESRAQMQTRFKFLEPAPDAHASITASQSESVEFLPNTASKTGENFRRTKQQLEALEAERQEFGMFLKNRHPKMINFSMEIDRITKRLAVYETQAEKEFDNQKSILSNQISKINLLIDEWEQSALESSKLLAQFERMRTRLQRKNALYDNLLDSSQKIDRSNELRRETVNVLEYASPAHELQHSMTREVVIGGVLGGVVGCGILLFLGLLDNRLSSAKDVANQFAFPVLTVVPREKKPFRTRNIPLLQKNDKRHSFVEAYRSARSSVMFMDHPGEKPSILLVTSAVPEEGKSTVSSNLAATLAFSNAKTLLIDADARRGKLHEQLNAPTKTGLSEYLNENKKLNDLIQETSIPNLDFLPCGSFGENPGEWYLNPRIETMLDELRTQYDYVILDSAPVLAVEESGSLALKADAVLFVIRAQHTQARAARLALDRLEMRGASILGIILNAAETGTKDYYYYYPTGNY